MKDYKQLIKGIQSRNNPETIRINESFSAEINSIKYSDVLTYIRYAMKGVEPAYTKNSKLAGERVKDHLKKSLTNVTYQYQGSVMTNTHIKGSSDIDLLVISDKFYRYSHQSINSILTGFNSKYSQVDLQKLQQKINRPHYSGSSLEDLRKNRIDSENTLNPIYEDCDISRAKAIKITNRSIKRDVDIVIANWYDNIDAILNDNDSDYRGIQVYDKSSYTPGDPDFPFLSIKRINKKSTATNGRLKKMIRFLKNVKADSTASEKIKLSSFDFNAICYDIDTTKYSEKKFYELVLVIVYQLHSLSSNSERANSLKSVDGNEFIFKDNPQKLESLKILINEISAISIDLNKTTVI